MKRVMLAIMSGLLLSCQGPGAVMAQEATAALATGAGSLIHRTRARYAGPATGPLCDG